MEIELKRNELGQITFPKKKDYNKYDLIYLLKMIQATIDEGESKSSIEVMVKVRMGVVKLMDRLENESNE